MVLADLSNQLDGESEAVAMELIASPEGGFCQLISTAMLPFLAMVLGLMVFPAAVAAQEVLTR